MRDIRDPGRSRIPAVFSAGAVAVLGLVVAAPPAQADPMDVLESAVATTIQAAAGGVNVVETVTFSRANDLRSTIFGGPSAKVAAGGRVRVHIAANTDGSYYETFRRVPSASLIGAGGRTMDADGGRWLTLSMMEPGLAASAAHDRRVALATAITRMDSGRMESLAAGGLMDDPIHVAVRFHSLPPDAESAVAFWKDVSAVPGAGGRTLVTATVPASNTRGQEATCTVLNAQVVIAPDGRIESSSWTSVCPKIGKLTHTSSTTYGPQTLKPATSPQLTMAAFLSRKVTGAAAGWSAIAHASQVLMDRPDPLLSVEIQGIDIRPDATATTSEFAVDSSSVDPVSGQLSHSATVNAVPVVGWNEVNGWWVRIPQAPSQGVLSDAVAAAGLPSAEYLVAGPPAIDRYFSPLTPPGGNPSSASKSAIAKAVALSAIDQISLSGQPGRVRKTAASGGGSLYEVTPAPGHTYLVGLPGALRALRAAVTVDATGAVSGVGVTYDFDGSEDHGNAYAFDGQRDREYVSSVSAVGVNLVSVPVGVPTALYAQVAPYLPW